MRYLEAIIFMMCFCFYTSKAQEVHLSYNFYDEYEEIGKTESKDEVNFFIGENNFIYKKQHHSQTIKSNTVLKNKVFTLDEFYNKVKIIKASSVKGKTIQVRKNSDYFKKIFLYEKADSCIYIYSVNWTDSVIDWISLVKD